MSPTESDSMRMITLRLKLNPNASQGKSQCQCLSVYILHSLIVVKGDLVKGPMKKGSFVPKNVSGWGGVDHAGVGWELLKEYKFNYNHTPKYVFLLSAKRETMWLSP